MSDDENKVIDITDEDSEKRILSLITENKETVISIKSVYPLFESPDIMYLLIRNKVQFTSVNEPELSKTLCNSFIEMSDKKGFKKAGNTQAHLNTVTPADNFAREIGPILDKLDKKKYKTLQSKADYLNDKRIKTLRGKDTWRRNTVKSTYERWQRLKAEEEEKTKNANNPKQLKP